MARPDEAAEYVRQGMKCSEIVERMGITAGSVHQYIHRAIGQQLIKPIDVVRTIPEAARTLIQTGQSDLLVQRIERGEIALDHDDLEVYRTYGDCVEDVYASIRKIEIAVHQLIKRSLRSKYDSDEKAWWVQGVPERTRMKCLERWTQDLEQHDPYCYTDLLDLWSIIDKQWSWFREKLPEKVRDDRKALKDRFARLNDIRRKVMHPSREQVPTDAEYDFTLEFAEQFQ